MGFAGKSGLISFGAFVPRARMARDSIADAQRWAAPSLKGLGKGERSVCAWDEDALTMAVEAGRDCLRGVDAGTVASLDIASTTAPFAELPSSVLAATALRLSSHVACADVGGSTRAGLSTLIRALRSPGEGGRLVIASDRRYAKPGSVQELQYGAGAAAILVGEGDDLIAEFLDAETVSVPFIDHFRQAGEKFNYYWEERWVRDEGIAKLVPAAVARLLARLGRVSTDIALFAMSGGPIGGDKLAAKALSIEPDRIVSDMQGKVGDSGTAQPLLQLAAALERAKPGGLIVIAAFGQGCEIAAFEMRGDDRRGNRRGLEGSIGRGMPEQNYIKMLSSEGNIQIDGGMRSETEWKTSLSQLYRSAPQILGFIGGKCSACGAIQFPSLPACVNCAALGSQSPYPLVDEPAAIATHTADWLQYSPEPPLYMGLVQFAVGARVMMEIVDVPPRTLEVGLPLEMALRVKERDRLRHFDRYFWKATPACNSRGQ